MPELPEVETVVCELRKTILGKRVEAVDVYLPKMVRPGPKQFSDMIRGGEITSVERLGKYIILSFRSNGTPEPIHVVIHLKMTGQLLYGHKTKDRPEYVHVKLSFKGKGALLYRDIRQFGFLQVMKQTGLVKWKKAQGLGPDPLELKPQSFVFLLRQRKGRIKSLLLNQRFICGLGNIYVDESLFAAGIHPLTPAGDIPEEQCLILHREMIKILKKAIQLKGSTITNFQGPNRQKGRFQSMHQVYRRQGESCPVCGQKITRIVVAGRGTHICLNCQKMDDSKQRE